MRCRRREGPWGSHQLDASPLKCDTSVGSTVPVVVDEFRLEDGVADKVCAGATRCIAFLRIAGLETCDMHLCIDRAALAGLYGFIVYKLVIESFAWC
jgi:hypothetical protein